MHCVKQVIQPNCGVEASRLFQHLVQAQVPTSDCALGSDATLKSCALFPVTFNNELVLLCTIISFNYLTLNL